MLRKYNAEGRRFSLGGNIALPTYSSVSNDTVLPKHLLDLSVFIDLDETVGSTDGRLVTHHGHPSINIVRARDSYDDIVL